MLSRKLKKILTDIYWDSKTGWVDSKTGQLKERRLPSAEKLKLLKEAGLYYQTETIGHDEVIKRFLAVRKKVAVGALTMRFLASLSSRDIEYRADLHAVLELPKVFEPHRFKGRELCSVCGIPEWREQDNTQTLFSRYKFGCACKYFLMDNVFLLERALHLAPVEPTREDIAIFIMILEMSSNLPPGAGPDDICLGLRGIIESNEQERRGLVEILGLLGILKPGDMSPEACARVPTRSNWDEPVIYWQGSDGVNIDTVKLWFGKHLTIYGAESNRNYR